MIYRAYYGGQPFIRFPGGGLGCLIAAALLLVGGYYVMKGLYYLLLWAGPALLVLSLFINWRVFPDTLNSWLRSFQRDPVMAVVWVALAVLAFPFFCLYIFLKAIGAKKMEEWQKSFGAQGRQREEETFVEYEELESQQKSTPEEDQKAPPQPEKPGRGGANPYDQMFGL
jgi:hypothetical protein